MSSRMIRAAIAMAVVGVFVPGAAGQDRGSQAEVRSQYDIGGMIDQAVRNISARYNLNQEQHEITQRMMVQGVQNFLAEHADQVYPLIRDLSRAGLSGRNMSVEQRKRIGVIGQPLIDAAKAEILKYNKQWGEILSEEQKGLHEWDLREMEGQFEQIHDNFAKMREGLEVDNPLFPEHQIKSQEPKQPSVPPVGSTPKLPPPVREQAKGDVFENYVHKFIKDYKLDAAQKATALSILKDYKAFADAYRKVKKNDFAKARKDAEQARKDRDIKKLKEAEKRLDKLNQRITQLFEEMKQRLNKIPRKSQKRAYQRQGDQKTSKTPGAQRIEGSSARPEGKTKASSAKSPPKPSPPKDKPSDAPPE